MSRPNHDKPLYGRLCHAFGTDAVHRNLDRLIARFNRDPLMYITDEGKDELFDSLRADLKWTKRNNARNRRIAAESKANGT